MPTQHYKDPRLEDRSQRIVCYCGGGHRSALAARTLQEMRKAPMRRLSLLLVATVLLTAGCSSASHQIVGTWKGNLVPPADTSTSAQNDPNVGNRFANSLKGMISSFVGPLTIEFNADGKYKASLAFGSATGTYSLSGDEVTMTPDDNQPQKNSNLKAGQVHFVLRRQVADFEEGIQPTPNSRFEAESN